MRKISKFFLILLFCSWYAAPAQNKYAVLVGINDYYIQPGVKHPKSLHGCVNDALSVKELLQNRFLFPQKNIETLFDSGATKTTVLKLLHSVLNKCHAGDAVFFYYSGHGAWMKNAWELDSVKRKKSQAMVLSNLYAPNLDCLLTDEELKTVFNEFVDKKVVVTTLFDCCYSGKMMMMPEDTYWMALPEDVPERSISMGDILFFPNTLKPAGCRADAFGNIVDGTDTDGDGVPDCADWELHTPPAVAVDSLGMMINGIAADEYIKQTMTDPRFADKQKDTPDSALLLTVNRSFNLKDALTLNIRPNAKRPTEREGSAFASLAAAADDELAAEITDESGMKHGAFTKALLTIYSHQSAGLLLDSLLRKVTALIKQQKYSQNPMYFYEKSRLRNNLIGLSHTRLSDVTTLHCNGVTNDTVSFDKGAYAGLAKGNGVSKTSKPSSKTVVLSIVSPTSSAAIDKSRSIKKGDMLKLVNTQIVRQPVVKLFIPEAPMSTSDFQTFFKTDIQPLVKDQFYADYNSPANDKTQTIQLYTGAKTKTSITNVGNNADGFTYSVILLPLPSYITTPLKKRVAQNQNIQLVNSINQADFVLYLNYTKAGDNRQAGFVFYYHPPMESLPNQVFSRDNFIAPSLSLAGKDLQAICESLYQLTDGTTRYKTSNWLIDKSKK